ncbi:hypothetical protein [Leptolyngbya phage Lbo-JY46]
MAIGINKTNLIFESIDTNNLITLLLLDLSHYHQSPIKPLFNIKVPGMSSYVSVPYNPNQLNVLNSHVLGLTLHSADFSNLPDGVYEIIQTICPYDELFNKKFILRDTVLINRLNELLQSNDFCCDCTDSSKLRDKLSKINLLLTSAKTSANFGDVKNATEKYKKALKIVNSLNS